MKYTHTLSLFRQINDSERQKFISQVQNDNKENNQHHWILFPFVTSPYWFGQTNIAAHNPLKHFQDLPKVSGGNGLNFQVITL